MGLNPLLMKKPPPEKAKTKAAPFTNWKAADREEPKQLESHPPVLSHREELAREAKKATAKVVIEVKAGEGQRGTYELPWSKGRTLGQYFAELNLTHLATRSRVYDLGNLEKGRLRLTYVPEPDTKLLIGGKDYSPMAQLQRKGVENVERVAQKMGGGKKFVEVNMKTGKVVKSND